METQNLTQHGTLVVSIPTQEGLVICADTRGHVEGKGNSSDTYTKIFQINETAAFASTGTVGFSNGSGRQVFNANDIVNEFVKGNKFNDSDSYVDDLRRALIQKFSQALSDRALRNWLPGGDPPDYTFFQTVFFYLDANNQPKVFFLKFTYNKATGNINCETYDPQKPPDTLPDCYGDAAVCVALFNSNQGYPELRQDAVVKRFLSRKVQAKDVTVSEATDYAMKVTKATNVINPKLVGPDCQCALISFKEGFKWLEASSATPTPAAQALPSPETKAEAKDPGSSKTLLIIFGTAVLVSLGALTFKILHK